MHRAFPRSLAFFLITGIVFVLQMIPLIGIFLMFMLAMFWSVLLINAGMIGTAIEAIIGRVSRLWLLLPLAFYGGYFAIAAQDQAALRALGASYDAANAKVTIPFDAAREALVFEGEGDSGGWLVQNYTLPVAYNRNSNNAEGFRSTRMMASAICARVQANPALRAAGVYTFGFHDGDAISNRKMEGRFCSLGMPERPTIPIINVTRHEQKTRAGLLPITRLTTSVAMPDGRRFTLLGGTASPLGWIPMPIMGCALNSGAPSWDCDAGFYRQAFTPIVSGNTRYSRDSTVLAKALGLKRVAIADRTGGDPAQVLPRIEAAEAATLARQLAAIDAMIADPLAKDPDWQVGVVAARPDALVPRAAAIVQGLERAASYSDWQDVATARDSGRILAGLIAKLPRETLISYGPRILALYERSFVKRPEQDGVRRDARSHWIWETDALIRRLGDLGIAALTVLIDPRASVSNVNGAGIEGLCRVGEPGKSVSEPVLLAAWQALDGRDRDQRIALYVALRRVGIEPPQVVESEAERKRRERGNSAFGGVFKQQKDPMSALREEWGNITPASPPRVCAWRAEQQARREEKYGDKRRRTNLD